MPKSEDPQQDPGTLDLVSQDLAQAASTPPAASPPAATQGPRRFTLSRATLAPGGTVEMDDETARQESLVGAAPRIPGYELQERLGAGTFGEVWSAIQSHTHQKVAVKILKRRGSGDVAYLEREVLRLGSVAEHPHVVTLLDANLVNDPSFFVTPLLHGSLENAVSPTQAVPVDRAATWFEQVARALQYVHSKGILHCDLKPANILLDDEGAVRVVDFGQAHLLGEGGLSLGTFWYMSPEQALVTEDGSATPDVSWDVYSLGATMYQMLTGRLPRATDEGHRAVTSERDTRRCLDQYREQLRTQPLLPIRSLNRKVDPDLAAIVEHCLEFDPMMRYHDMGDALDDLRRRRERLPLLCRPRTPWYVASRFLARYPVASASLVLLLFLLVNFIVTTRASHLEAVAAQEKAENASKQARHDLAEMEKEHGQGMIDRGVPGGLLWIAKAARDAPDPQGALAAASQELLHKPRLQCLVQHDGPIVDAALSPDARTLVTTSRDRTARLWDVATGKPAGSPLQHDAVVRQAIFSPDGKYLATVAGDSVRVWDARTGDAVTKPLRHPGSVLAVQWGSGWIATGDAAGTTRLWSLPSGAVMGEPIREGRPVQMLGLGGRTLMVVAGTAIRIHDLDGAPNLRLSFPGMVVSAALDRGATRVAASVEGSGAWLVDLHPVRRRRLPHRGTVYGIRFSPDGTRVLTASDDKTAALWSAASGAQIASLQHGESVLSAAFSADGRSVVTASADRTAQAWDAATGKRLGPPLQHSAPVMAARFSGDGRRIVTVTGDGSVQVWAFGSSRPLTPSLQHTGLTQAAWLSPDGGRLVVVSGSSARVMALSRIEVKASARKIHRTGDIPQVGLAAKASETPEEVTEEPPGDLDEPPELLQLEAELATGFVLTDEPSMVPLDATALQERRARWQEAGPRHAADCKYPDYNLWNHEHQRANGR